MKKEQGNRGIKSGAKGGRRAWHLGRVSSCSVSQGGSGVGGTRPWGRWDGSQFVAMGGQESQRNTGMDSTKPLSHMASPPDAIRHKQPLMG